MGSFTINQLKKSKLNFSITDIINKSASSCYESFYVTKRYNTIVVDGKSKLSLDLIQQTITNGIKNNSYKLEKLEVADDIKKYERRFGQPFKINLKQNSIREINGLSGKKLDDLRMQVYNEIRSMLYDK